MPEVLASFARCRRAGDGWSAQCPAHEDAKNSLSIHRGDDGRWLLCCHAGCALDAILAAAHLTTADLFPSRNGNGQSHASIVATYDYTDAAGVLRYQVVRSEPKAFRPRRPDGAGGWIGNLQGIERVLYRLRELQGHATVYVVEGEKDADRLWSLGVAATTNAFGAGKWQATYTQQLLEAGCRAVVLLPDNDAPGAAHGRTVARSCVDAGLRVQVIALPDLPSKGDVSDYLARHTIADLTALVQNAPLARGDERVAEPPALTLSALAEFLDEPDVREEWIVTDRIPAGGVVLFAGAPKAGKSTCVRELAAAVSTGESWLGWPTRRGLVWLLAFEDKRSEVQRHLRSLDVSRDALLRMFIDQAPVDLLAQLHVLANTERPALIIIDTLARALRLRDVNDYALVSAAFEPWHRLARTTGATLLFVHHASVHTAREGLDAILGSTAFAGSVDNVLILRRVDGQRVLSTVQRVGRDLEPTILTLGDDGRLACGGTKRLVDDAELRDRLVAALADAGEPVRESWLHDQVEGRKADKVRALRILLSQRRVTRTGRGGRGEPFLYELAESDSGSQIAHAGGRNGNQKGGREPAKPEKKSMGVLLFDDSGSRISGPHVRSSRESDVRGEEEVQGPRSDSGSRDSENRETPALKSDECPDKHGSDSGSQILKKEADDDDAAF
jgi:hypothetical protein